MVEKTNRRKMLKYSSLAVAGLAMPGIGSAQKPKDKDRPNIEKTEVVRENKNYRFRRTVANGKIIITKFDKDTGSVDFTIAGQTNDGSGTESGISTQSSSVEIDSQLATSSTIIEESIGYSVTIEDQCHLTQCDRLEDGFTNKGDARYDHRISGTSYRLTKLAGTITNAVIAAALLEVFMARLPAVAVTFLKNRTTLKYTSEAVAAVMGSEIGGREFSFATYDYDLGSVGVYTPKVGSGVSNTWKGKKNSLIPLAETVFFGNDIHLGSKCNLD